MNVLVNLCMYHNTKIGRDFRVGTIHFVHVSGKEINVKYSSCVVGCWYLLPLPYWVSISAKLCIAVYFD